MDFNLPSYLYSSPQDCTPRNKKNPTQNVVFQPLRNTQMGFGK